MSEGSTLEDIYRDHGAALHAMARRVLRSEADVSDCVHDVLERVLRRAAYRPERGSLRTYLLVAVRNEAVTRVRRARRHAEIEFRASAGEPATYAFDGVAALEARRVREAVTRLPIDQRTALELAYRGGLSHTEIADRLGVPLGTIKSRLVLAMRKLRTAME